MLGFIAGILLSRREARRLGLSTDIPLDLGVWVLIAGIAFARAMYVLLDWEFFADRPLEILYVWREGGLSFHGGLLGGILAGIVFTWQRKLSFWKIADMVAPGLALGYGIARFGCLLNGCCYGAPTDLPWGVQFPRWPDSEIMTAPLHPTQIYAALGSWTILAVLMACRRRLTAPGQLFCLYLMLYAPMRSIVEVFRRGYSAQVLFDGVTEAQAASAFIFLIACVGFVIRGRRARSGAEREPQGDSP